MPQTQTGYATGTPQNPRVLNGRGPYGTALAYGASVPTKPPQRTGGQGRVLPPAPPGGGGGGGGTSGGGGTGRGTSARAPVTRDTLLSLFNPAYYQDQLVADGGAQTAGRYTFRTPDAVRAAILGQGGSQLLSQEAGLFGRYTNWYNSVVAPYLQQNPEYDALSSGIAPFDPDLDGYPDESGADGAGGGGTGTGDITQAMNDFIAALTQQGGGGVDLSGIENRLAAIERGQNQGIPSELLIALLGNQQNNDEQFAYPGAYFGGYY